MFYRDRRTEPPAATSPPPPPPKSKRQFEKGDDDFDLTDTYYAGEFALRKLMR